MCRVPCGKCIKRRFTKSLSNLISQKLLILWIDPSFWTSWHIWALVRDGETGSPSYGALHLLAFYWMVTQEIRYYIVEGATRRSFIAYVIPTCYGTSAPSFQNCKRLGIAPKFEPSVWHVQASPLCWWCNSIYETNRRGLASHNCNTTNLCGGIGPSHQPAQDGVLSGQMWPNHLAVDSCGKIFSCISIRLWVHWSNDHYPNQAHLDI